MLVGRAAEQRRIDELIGAAARGQSGVLIIRGDAGVGKSALLQYARAKAVDLPQLSAVGVASEMSLPFAALSELTRPLTDLIPTLPEPQSAALAGALALGPPAPGDRFAVAAATLSLLAAGAEAGGLLVTGDDLQWMDASSREAIIFAARRLHAEGIAMLLASMDTGPIEADLRGLEEMTLGGLDEGGTGELLSLNSKEPAHPDVVAQVHAATGGYPLPVVELARLLTPAQLRGSESLPDPLPAGETMERWFYDRVQLLPDGAQRALLLIATADSTDAAFITALLTKLEIPPGSLEAAEQAGLMILGGGALRFRHPLIRAAVYHRSRPADRRAMHRLIAAELDDAGSFSRAWHRAAAAATVDEQVAGELEALARAAELRGGYPASARALQRAAELSEDHAARNQRLVAAARAWQSAGNWSRAIGLLDQVEPAGDAVLETKCEQLRGEIELWTGTPMAAHARLAAAALRVAATDPVTAVTMLSTAATGCFMAGAIPDARAIAEKAFALAAGKGGFAEQIAAVTLGEACLLSGETSRTRELLKLNTMADPLPPQQSLPLLPFIVFTAVNLEEFELARKLLEQMLTAVRQLNAPSMLPYTLSVLSELEFRTGRWNQARAAASEAVRLGTELDQRSGLAYGLVCLARVEAGLGEVELSRENVSRALVNSETYGTKSIEHYAFAILGFIDLGAGRFEQAISLLRKTDELRVKTGLRAPSVVMSQADLIESLLRTDRREDAAAALDVLEAEAELTSNRWARGTAARCRAMLSESLGWESGFGDSIELLSEMPFEQARTRLCFGERLRRNRQRSAARDQLRGALDLFEGIGAEQWAVRARGELGRLGERRSSATGPVARRLTNQELQVSLMVAEGATNQEVASRLFLSRKTVEAHLSSVYGKLAIRSRTQLARILMQETAG